MARKKLRADRALRLVPSEKVSSCALFWYSSVPVMRVSAKPYSADRRLPPMVTGWLSTRPFLKATLRMLGSVENARLPNFTVW